jgi:ribosomal protein S18 acetylase RimI-like enzyme
MERFLEPLGVCFRWRAAMGLRLADLTEPAPPPSGYEIVPWDPACLNRVAEVDWHAYRNTIDATLYWRYFRSPRDCRRMWEEAQRGKFGVFDRERTRLLLCEGRICGDILSVVRPTGDGFIANLAVLPEHRGGTGRALLLSALWAFREAGFERVTLAVTLANEQAYRLYTAVGFRRLYRFPVATRPGPWGPPWRTAGGRSTGLR